MLNSDTEKLVSQQSKALAADFLHVIDKACVPIFGTDRQGQINVWNEKIANLTGCSKEEVKGQSLVEKFIAEESRSTVQKAITSAISGQTTDEMEAKVLKKDGTTLCIAFNVHAQHGQIGDISGVLMTGWDMTTQRHAEAENKRTSEEMDHIIESAHAPAFGINAAGLITHWNSKSSMITGWAKEETFGSKFEAFLVPEVRAVTMSVIHQALGGEESQSFTAKITNKVGGFAEVTLNATAVRNAEGEVVGVIGIGQIKTAESFGVSTAASRMAKELTLLIDTTNAPIFGTDMEGRINEWNKKAAMLSGYSKEEASGTIFAEAFISPQDREEVNAVLRNALYGHETCNFEFPFFTKDGQRREILFNMTARRDADGTVTGAIGVGQDITDLRAMTAEQRRIAEDLSRLIETANAPIFGVSVDGKVTEWNRKAAELSGYSSEETAGRLFVEEFIPLDHKERVQAVLTEACQGTQAVNFEFPLMCKSGQQIIILLNATTRRNETGEVTGVVGVGQDISSLRQAVNEAGRIAEDLMRLVDTANAPIFGIDVEGKVNEWNQKAAILSGWNKEDSLGMPLVESFISEDYRDEVNRVLNLALAGRDTSNFEFPLFTKSGQRREILLNATTRRGGNGEITGVIGVGQDITELRAVTEEHKHIADDLSRLIETANAPIFGVSVDGLVTEWNKKAAELSGFTKEETMGKLLVDEFITHDYKAKVQAVLTQACAGVEAANFEFPLLTRDGSRIDILLNATTRRNAQGQVTGVVGVGQEITNLRQAMNETRKVAEDLTRLIDTANAPILGISRDGCVTEWNQKAAAISGWDKTETLGKKLVEQFISDDYRSQVLHVLQMALEGHETANFEFPLFTKDGNRREILLNATTRRGADGEITGVIGVGQDITELRAMTAEQHRIADDLQRLIETANAPIFGVNVDGHVTEWNRKAAELSGYSKQETMNRPLVADFITIDYKEKVRNVLMQAIKGFESQNFEFPLVTKNGKRVDILLNATTRRDEKGNVIGVLGVGQDITNLREAMNETQRTADDLMRLIDTANAPIFGIDTEGNVTEWNQKAAHLSGWPKSETQGKPLVKSFISAEYRHEVNRVLTKALKGDETANYEFPLFTKDGRRREILLNATTRRGADGLITGVIGVGQDITELRNITAEQQRVADDLSRLIETANAPIFGVSINGRVTEWNKKAADLTGFTKDETMGRPLVEEFITAEYQDKVEAVLTQACMGVETANFEFPLLTKDDKRIDILLNATTRRNAQGQVTGVVGVGQEITILRQAMNQTSQIADDLMRLIDRANAPIFGIDTKGCTTEWNQKAASISGWSKAETFGKPLVEHFISENYRAEVWQILEKALGGTETANYEFPLFTKDGSRREILLNATTRRGATGEITGVIGVGQDITELRAMTAEQHRIADDLSRLIESANAPIFGVSVDGHVTEWNRKAATLLGYSKEETMGQPLVHKFITSEYKAKVQAVLAQACEGEETANFEFPLVTRDGQRIDILLNATTRRDAKGQVTGVVGVGQDITTLRQAMNDRSRVADDLTRLIDTANAPIFGIDTKGCVTEWNQKAAAISGWDKAHTVGKPMVESFITLEYRQEVNRVLNMALSGQETANFAFPLFTKDGQRREILLNATTRRGADGEVTGVIGVGQDITELRQLMAEQHRIADDLSRLIETANAPIFGVSVDGMVTEWNKKAAELSGYSPEETMGKPLVQNFISEEYQHQVQVVLTRACQGRETANFEFPLLTKDNKRIYILLNAATRRDASGEIIGVVGVGQDITELREAMSYSRSVADDLTRLIDTANAPIFGIDTSYNVTEWNRMATKITRFEKRSAIGKPMVESFIHVDNRESVREVFDRALMGEEVANFEFPLYTRSGEKREILLNATTRCGPDGEVIGVLGVGQDITELNIQRRESERIASDLARLIDTANAPIFGVDVQGCIKEWNRKAAELSGYSKDEIKGKRLVQSLVAVECQHKVAYVLLKALGGQESSDFEFPLITKNGDQRDVLMNATAQRGADNEVTGVIGVGHDITEIRQMAAKQKNLADDLARLVRSANAPIFGVNTQGELTEWNDKAAALLGYTKEEALGKPFVDTFIREDVRAEVRAVIENACHGVETTHFECPLIDREGGEVLVMVNAATRMDAAGRINGMVGVGQDITNLRKAMTEITFQADDLRRIIDHANAPILGIDTEGCVTEWNQKVAEISHYTKEEMLGQNLIQTFIHEEYREEVGRILRMALEGGETDNYEFPLYTKSGGRHEVLFNATTRRGPDGNITGVIGVGQNITKIKQITLQQERIADDLSRLIETANAPIFGVDTKGLITEWNRKAVEISGFTKQETYGQSLVNRFIHQVHRQSVQAVLDQALSSQEVEHIELMLYTRGGEQRDILLNATPRKGADGNVVGVVLVGQDITELNKHRKESERIAEDLSQLIDTANAPIFGVDKDMHINEWNKWVAKHSGFQKQDVVGKSFATYINKDCRAMVLRVLAEASKGNLSSNFEVELSTQSNQKRVFLLLNATPRVSPQGDIVGVICVGQDIADIKEIEQKKSSFMAMVSHELKSPLHGIIGLSSSMSDTPGIEPAVQKPLQLIQSCATRLLDMVSNIMDASVLVQDKKMRFSRDTVQMANIVEEVLVLCQHSIDKRGNPVVKTGVSLVNAVTTLPEIEADAHRCTQIVYNLVTNALKFTHAGYVRVTGGSDDAREEIRITVEDTGIGISQDNLERIFQPFDQEDQSETRRYDGLGLGLAICREVAYKHGGSLTVESEKGKGSKFHVSLPYKMSQAVFEGTEVCKNEGEVISEARRQEIAQHQEQAAESPAKAGSSAPVQQLMPMAPLSNGAKAPPLRPMPAAAIAGSPPIGMQLMSGGPTALPAPPPAMVWPQLPQGESKPGKTYTARILSVDDDEVNHEVMVATLGKCDYEVVVLLSGTACLKYIEECTSLPDIILLDVTMPGISGLDVLAELRKQFSVVQLPIIMVSAKNSTSAAVKGLELGCNDWVHKPFDRLELIARVKAQLLMRELFKEKDGSIQPALPPAPSAEGTDTLRASQQRLEEQLSSAVEKYETLKDEAHKQKQELDRCKEQEAQQRQELERCKERELERSKVQTTDAQQPQKQEGSTEQKQDTERAAEQAAEAAKQKQLQDRCKELDSEVRQQKQELERCKEQTQKAEAALQRERERIQRPPQTVRGSAQAPLPFPPLGAVAGSAASPPLAKANLPLSSAQKPKSVKEATTQTLETLGVPKDRVGAAPTALPGGLDLSKIGEAAGLVTHLMNQNAHLGLQIRSRQRQLQASEAKIMQQTVRAEVLEQRVIRLEESLRRTEVDVIFFGTARRTDSELMMNGRI